MSTPWYQLYWENLKQAYKPSNAPTYAGEGVEYVYDAGKVAGGVVYDEIKQNVDAVKSAAASVAGAVGGAVTAPFMWANTWGRNVFWGVVLVVVVLLIVWPTWMRTAGKGIENSSRALGDIDISPKGVKRRYVRK